MYYYSVAYITYHYLGSAMVVELKESLRPEAPSEQKKIWF